MNSNKLLKIVVFTYAIIWGLYWMGIQLYKYFLKINDLDITYGFLKKSSVISDLLFNIFGIVLCIVSVKNKELREEIKNSKITQFVMGIIVLFLVKNLARILGMII